MADSPVGKIHLQCLWAGMHPVVMRTRFLCCFLGWRIPKSIPGQSGWGAFTWPLRTQETVPGRCRPTSSLWPTDPRLNRKRSSNRSWSTQDQCPEAAILGCVREGQLVLTCKGAPTTTYNKSRLAGQISPEHGCLKPPSSTWHDMTMRFWPFGFLHSRSVELSR